MALLLISPAEIRTYRTLSVNIPDERIEPFILEAQHFDLRKVTGKALYDKLVEEVSPANYPLLAAQYMPFLAYRAYYRLLSNNQITVTPNGVVYKTNDYSTNVPVGDLAAIRNHVLDGSKVYEQDFIDYMNADSTDAKTNYPEWLESGCCTCGSKGDVYGGVRISSVGRPVTNERLGFTGYDKYRK
jgi:hypothetical protein